MFDMNTETEREKERAREQKNKITTTKMTIYTNKLEPREEFRHSNQKVVHLMYTFFRIKK